MASDSPSRLRALIPGGMRWRLTAWVAVVLLVTSSITFVAIYRGTGSQLRDQIDREIGGDASAFVRHMAAFDDVKPAALQAAAASYLHFQPFRATSRLLYVTLPGRRTVTNEPELLGLAARDDREPTALQRRENAIAGALLTAPLGYSDVPVPDVGRLRLLIRPLTVEHRVLGRIGVGEPLASVDRAQHGIARAFLLAGALSLLGALLASYLVGASVSRPLRRIARVAARVDAGDLAPRLHSRAARGTELRVLADSFDRMLERLADAFARQRAFISDASHELRTPLTVIRGQLELLVREERPSPEEVRRVERLVQAEISRMSRLVDDLLLLAHSDEREFLRPEEIDVEPYVAELWEGVPHTADRQFELRVQAGGRLQADGDRLAQALRNLIRNAVEHTEPGSGRVRLTVTEAGPGRLRFAVEDDGPGIPADQRALVFDRFHRTDAARNRASGGSGLGLAIVLAIVEAHGGSVGADASASLGGALVAIELPGFVPLAESAPRTPDAVAADGAVSGPVAVAGASTPKAPTPGPVRAHRR